jgi:AraC family transcriptional activator FtrA
MKDIASPHRVVAIAYDRLCTFEFGIAVEVFGLPRPELGVTWYDFAVAAVEAPIRATGGFRVEANGGVELLAVADTVVIPGWRGPDHADVPPTLVEAVCAAHARGARLLAVCTGVFVLAAAGLMDGRRAAAHWFHHRRLQAAYPAIRFVDDVLYVDDGQIVTSAGSCAGIDAALHLVRLDHGAWVANAVARRLVMPPHRDGAQAQVVEAPVQVRPGRSVAPALDWARGRLSEPLGLGEMARAAGMSERTFLRRFRESTGMTPSRWLRAERMRRARELLETTDMALSDVAEACGFRSPETFRATFREAVGLPPAAFRQRYRACREDCA